MQLGWPITGMHPRERSCPGERPFVFANLYDGVGLETIISFILERGMLPERRPAKLAETA